LRSAFSARFSLSSRSRFILLIVVRFAVDIRNVLSSKSSLAPDAEAGRGQRWAKSYVRWALPGNRKTPPGLPS
jgi:hypothetical protein